jgi:hypothetical protein
MTHVGYLIAGWGVAFAVFALYAVSVMRRAKKLAAKVPAERARWMTGKDADVIGES